VASRIFSKDSFDKGVLGGCREEVLLLIFAVLRLVGDDVGEGVKTGNWGWGDGGAGDDIVWAIRDVEEGVVFRVVKDRPGGLGGRGMWDRSNR